MTIKISVCSGKQIDAKAPEAFQVMPFGEVHIEGEAEPVIMDDHAARLVMDHFNGLGHDVVIDYEHQTLSTGKAPAAGWVKSLDWRGEEGMWATVEWTEEAAAHIAKKEYRYHSPVLLSRKTDGRVIQMYNLALTNQPRMMNVAAIAAKKDLSTLLEQEGKTMFKRLIALFKLDGAATEDQVVEAVEAVVAKNTLLEKEAGDDTRVVACKGVLDVLKLPEDAVETDVIGAITALSATDTAAQDLSLQVAKLTAEIAAMKQEDLCALALKNGQTSPEELDKWGRDLAKTSPRQFELIVLSRPAGSVIPVDGARVVGDKTVKDGLTDDVQLSINKMMGVDGETWKAHGPDAQAG